MTLSFSSLADNVFQIIGIHGRGKGYVYNKKALTKERFGTTGQEDKKKKKKEAACFVGRRKFRHSGAKSPGIKMNEVPSSLTFWYPSCQYDRGLFSSQVEGKKEATGHWTWGGRLIAEARTRSQGVVGPVSRGWAQAPIPVSSVSSILLSQCHRSHLVLLGCVSPMSFLNKLSEAGCLKLLPFYNFVVQIFCTFILDHM